MCVLPAPHNTCLHVHVPKCMNVCMLRKPRATLRVHVHVRPKRARGNWPSSHAYAHTHTVMSTLKRLRDDFIVAVAKKGCTTSQTKLILQEVLRYTIFCFSEPSNTSAWMCVCYGSQERHCVFTFMFTQEARNVRGNWPSRHAYAHTHAVMSTLKRLRDDFIVKKGMYD